MMTSAEFQCAREYLGLPAVWVAEQLGVDRRSVHRWENGKTSLPPLADEMMRQWLARTSQAVGKVTVQIMETTAVPLEATPDIGFEYMAAEGFPSSWQRMLCSRVAERTGRAIVWMEAP